MTDSYVGHPIFNDIEVVDELLDQLDINVKENKKHKASIILDLLEIEIENCEEEFKKEIMERKENKIQEERMINHKELEEDLNLKNEIIKLYQELVIQLNDYYHEQREEDIGINKEKLPELSELLKGVPSDFENIIDKLNRIKSELSIDINKLMD
eukprot:TRINITY_DN5395_c0_g1_i1.p1 TRINITY_DN5395_c0_g1~~TRINITY_DN5395_c0_g1_i1.p1  ORF type:complete len:155 (-),score=37.52 TRINITY_DN5395_c0_g1_i1:84-548(-)